MEIKNRKFEQEEFLEERKTVMEQWPTGKDCDLDEAIEYHKTLPPDKNWTKKLRYAREHNEIYAISGMGKATLEEHIDMLRFVEEEGQADLLGTSVDSLSRQLNFSGAEAGIQKSLERKSSMLNGLPIVNHGVAGIRKIMAATRSPIAMRYGAADPRLIDEIGFAGGHTAGATDALMDFWHHHAKVSLKDVIRTHQYVHRLIGYYEEHGVPICASCQGLYGAGIPPTLQAAAILVQILIMAEQGVKNARLHFAAHGNLVQDVTTARLLRKLSKHYLEQSGYQMDEIFLSVSFSLVQYPLEPGAAFAVAFMNTLMTKLCGSQTSDIRTIAEAKGIPTKEDTAYTFRTAKAMQNFVQAQKIEVDEKEIHQEMENAETEVRCLVDTILEMGGGDPVIGTTKAVENGVLDNPFATNSSSACKVMGIKDAQGAYRYLNHGNLPFPREVINFNQDKLRQREKASGKKLDYEILVDDLMAVSKGFLVSN